MQTFLAPGGLHCILLSIAVCSIGKCLLMHGSLLQGWPKLALHVGFVFCPEGSYKIILSQPANACKPNMPHDATGLQVRVSDRHAMLAQVADVLLMLPDPKPAQLVNAIDFRQLSRAEAKLEALMHALRIRPLSVRCNPFHAELMSQLGRCLMTKGNFMGRKGLMWLEVDKYFISAPQWSFGSPLPLQVDNCSYTLTIQKGGALACVTSPFNQKRYHISHNHGRMTLKLARVFHLLLPQLTLFSQPCSLHLLLLDICNAQ